MGKYGATGGVGGISGAAMITAAKAIAGMAKWNRGRKGRPGPIRGRMPWRKPRSRKPKGGHPRDVYIGRRKREATVERNRRDIKKMKCFINNRTAEHTYRVRRTGTVRAGVNAVASEEISTLGHVPSIEGSAANLRYFDPATNALVTKDAASGTYSRDACLTIIRKLFVKNNYQVPCKVEVWTCRPKDATDVTPEVAFASGLADQGGASVTSPLMSYTDSRDLTNIWDISCCTKKVLNPGESTFCRVVDDRFDWTFHTNDADTAYYKKNQGGHVFVLRVYGTLGHDTAVSTEIGRMEGGIDWEFSGTVKWEYDAGKDLEDYSINDLGATAFTNSGVQSLKPISDNQSYSIA